MSRTFSYLLLIVCSYLIGAIPFSLIFSKLMRGVDVRKKGSGNVGATNTLVTSGRRSAALAVTFDIAKGFAAVVIARLLLGDDVSAALAGIVAVAGHDFPVYLGFSGGKGLSTTVGAIIAFDPYAIFAIVTIYLLLLAITRYLILSSLIALAIAPAIFFLLKDGWPAALFALVSLLFALYVHREDIFRLLAGREMKFGEAVARVL